MAVITKEKVAQAWKDFSYEQREDVLSKITKKDKWAIPLLKKATKDRYQPIRLLAVEKLGIIGDPSVIPTLSRSMEDKDEEVRRKSFSSIVKLYGPTLKLFPYTVKALKDPSDKLRDEAFTHAVDLCGNKSLVPRVIPRLIEVIREDPKFANIKSGTMTVGTLFSLAVGFVEAKDKETIAILKNACKNKINKYLLSEALFTEERDMDELFSILSKGTIGLKKAFPTIKFEFDEPLTVKMEAALIVALKNTPKNQIKFLNKIIISDEKIKKVEKRDAVTGGFIDKRKGDIILPSYVIPGAVSHEVAHLYHLNLIKIADLSKTFLKRRVRTVSWYLDKLGIPTSLEMHFNKLWEKTNKYKYGRGTMKKLWKDKNPTQPVNGFARRYGAFDILEDVATFVELAMYDPKSASKLWKTSEVAKKKIALLHAFGFIKKEHFDKIVKREKKT